MSFDDPIERRGTHSAKWDMMEKVYGVSPTDGIPMWVADMDFRPPDCVRRAVADMADHGVFGYYGDDASYRDAITWWMGERHGWTVDPAHILTTHGLVNGTGICVQSFTAPGDAVVLMTPVYHAFARVIEAAGRSVTECDMTLTDGRYTFDTDQWEATLTGRETMFVLCSPHNPGGRVWTAEELEAIAEFCRKHDLILISDEIHHDLVFPGRTHIPMATLPGIEDRLVTMTATTKTFNIAGSHTGNLIVADEALRAKLSGTLAGLGLSPNSFGLHMAEAAYSPEGAAWVDELIAYLDGNRKIFDAAIADIPGLASMPLEATYLAWVDFGGAGMSAEEAASRVEGQARIAANHGPTFGSGGGSFLRFNFATRRALVEEAAERLKSAFSDLQ
ncbi:MalY/PatB family protein [Tropicimonas sp. IMCC34011]|uniref:MalY/PatB family protein n=1 Tax=Tropicimonas sp. IMCC34011 TaxID=2248759 RepID=UPI000E26AB44|nr:MalY/PatB family protein [Tropicimonas sp. IMCC34011]